MKRIDDKIKEIEKKDKTNRWLFYGIIVIIIGFLYYASTTQKTIDNQKGTIAEQLETIKGQLEKEQELSQQLEDSINELNRSLKPDEYWAHTKSENSVEGYIAFVTNDWGIDKKAFIPKAIENLQSSNMQGFNGWLFVGSKNNVGTYENRDAIEIIYRQFYAGDAETLKDLEPKVGDIVKLKTALNRKTYANKSLNGNAKSQGWRNKTKAFVSEVYKDPGSTNFNIKIKYY